MKFHQLFLFKQFYILENKLYTINENVVKKRINGIIWLDIIKGGPLWNGTSLQIQAPIYKTLK